MGLFLVTFPVTVVGLLLTWMMEGGGSFMLLLDGFGYWHTEGDTRASPWLAEPADKPTGSRSGRSVERRDSSLFSRFRDRPLGLFEFGSLLCRGFWRPPDFAFNANAQALIHSQADHHGDPAQQQ